MSDNDSRRKMISLRLSEEEYEALKRSYRTYGVRNVSELARLALQRVLDAKSPEEQVALESPALSVRVQALESQMALLLVEKPVSV